MKTKFICIVILSVLAIPIASDIQGQDVEGRNLKLYHYGTYSEGPFIELKNKFNYIGGLHRDVWRFTHNDATGYLKLGIGRSTTTDNPTIETKFLFYTSGSFTAHGSIQATMFRDKSNSNYFLDPANTGISLKVAGKIESKEIEVVDLNTDFLKSDEIKTKDLNVEMNNVADYVFEDNYHLRSLADVEEFVKENKHLPDVPSAEELESSGMNVATMNNLLLQKVEELTLYIIELEKRIQDIE